MLIKGQVNQSLRVIIVNTGLAEINFKKLVRAGNLQFFLH